MREVGFSNTNTTSKNVVVLCEHFVPTTTQVRLLEKGLTFIPTPKPHKNQRLMLEHDVQTYHRRVELALYFKDSKRKLDKTNIKHRFIPPSTWRPPKDKLPPEMSFLIKADLNSVKHLNLNKSVELNITKEERKELLQLKNNSNLVIKSADKGNAVVLMDRKQYVFEANRQLSDTKYYKLLEAPIYPQTVPMIRHIVDQLYKFKYINAKQRTYLQGPREPRVRRFYILPKIHKEPEKWTVPGKIAPGRPIVSDCSSESYATAEYLEFYLNPLSQRHPSYIKDTQDFINHIKELVIPEHSLFFTIDIDSLYTNIPIKEGIDSVRKIFAMYPDPTRPDEALIQLLHINLTRNDFVFDSKYYLQTHGTAMGKRYAPSYANIFMFFWEEEVLRTCQIKPLVYLRYLDDIFGIWTDSVENFDQFLKTLDSFNPSIRIKHTSSTNSVDFLDTTVFKGPNFSETHKVDIKVYFKDTDSHALLHTSSFHPRSTCRAIVKSQLIRFYRICTRKEDFIQATITLFKALRKRGYSRLVLRTIFKSFLRKGSEKKENLIPIITTYSPISQELNPRIKNNFFQYITSQGLLSKYSLISAFKKNPNYKQLLVRAVLPTVKPFIKPNALDETFVRLNLIKSKTTGLIYQLTQSFSPNTSNCIYLIYCKQCGLQYVGQTGSSLRIRYTQHRYNFRRGRKLETPLARHFAMLHGPSAARIAGLESCASWNEQDRLKAEINWINKLKTRQPQGLNIKGGRKSPPKSSKSTE